MVGVLLFSLVGSYERPSVADMRAESLCSWVHLEEKTGTVAGMV